MRIRHLRDGLSLVELLTVVAIIGVLVALLIPAIMRIRETACILESKNNMRQIILAVHSFGSSRQGALPTLGYARARVVNQVTLYPEPGPALFIQILPYMEGGAFASTPHGQFQVVPLLLSPADPGAAVAIASNSAVSSYAANGVVFVDPARLDTTFRDGTSNTIAFGEHYAFDCNGHSFQYWQAIDGTQHRPAFADLGDVQPITKGNPPVSLPPSRPSLPAKTFQVAPRPKQCSTFVAQTPHSSGMIVAMADGSVRQVAPSIAVPVFWGAVTPNRGELINLDW